MITNEKQPLKILLISPTSFLGQHLTDLLLSTPHDLHVLTRSPINNPNITEHLYNDICDTTEIINALKEKPDVIINLAAIVDTITTPNIVELHRINYLGPLNLLELVSSYSPKSKIILTSSAFVYGTVNSQDLPITEETSLHPQTHYGLSKMLMEESTKLYPNLSILITRPFQLTGPNHTGAYAIPDWTKQLLEIKNNNSPAIISVGNLDIYRDYLDVRDCARAYKLLAETNLPLHETYNIASGKSISMKTILEILINQLNITVEIKTDPSRMRPNNKDNKNVYADITKIKNTIIWKPQHNIEETLNDLIKSYDN